MAAHHTFNTQCSCHSFFLFSFFRFLRPIIGNYRGGDLFSDLFILSCVVYSAKVQPQCVCDHTEARKTHCRRAEHRVQLPPKYADKKPRGKRNAYRIVEKRPEKIFVNVSQCRPAQAHSRRNVRKTAPHKHNICGVNCNIGTRANGNTDISARKRRGIVDAVPHHSDVSVLLELPYHIFLAVGQDSCDHLIHARLSAYCFCGALVIPRKHYHVNAHILQFTDSARAVLLYHIRNGNYPGKLPAAAEKERRFALLCQSFGL